MEDTKPITFSLIQTDLFWEDKGANLDMLEKKINSITVGTHVIVLPEMFPTGYTMNSAAMAETMNGRVFNWMKQISSSRNAVITGSVIVKENGKYFNRLIWMLPNGDFGIYDKRHLFGFAGEHNFYWPGNKKLIASLNGWKINLQVCYDLRFPVWSRQPVNEEEQYDIYINVASWPDKRRNAWKTLLIARAIENQVFVVGVNRVGTDGNGHHYAGDSMIVDPLGEVLYIKEETEDIFTYTFEKRTVSNIRSHFPFLRDADGFQIMNKSKAIIE